MVPPPFHERFEIQIGMDGAKQRFVNRVENQIFENLIEGHLQGVVKPHIIRWHVANALGYKYQSFNNLSNPHLLADVVTDMYESVEALSKIVTGRDSKDLSANAELFVRSINASAHYKQILKDYISYANEFRHAAKQGAVRPQLSPREVESFVYLTGVFIRLAVQK